MKANPQGFESRHYRALVLSWAYDKLIQLIIVGRAPTSCRTLL